VLIIAEIKKASITVKFEKSKVTVTAYALFHDKKAGHRSGAASDENKQRKADLS